MAPFVLIYKYGGNKLTLFQKPSVTSLSLQLESGYPWSVFRDPGVCCLRWARIGVCHETIRVIKTSWKQMLQLILVPNLRSIFNDILMSRWQKVAYAIVSFLLRAFRRTAFWGLLIQILLIHCVVRTFQSWININHLVDNHL